MQYALPPSLRLARAALLAGALALLGLGLGLAVPGCRVGYVVRSAWFEADLLSRRQPVDKVIASGTLTEAQRAALATIADVKAFGESIGLKPTRNYGAVAVGWNREIWNVSACDPLSFTPRTWWFPIVGRVPYLGYFRKSDADETVSRLSAEGLDAYARTAGAYSTLGWFRDPILPDMLSWGEYDLADSVLHELAHATVWIPGSVSFNESFASFVGEETAFRYLATRHGDSSPQLARARADFEDLALWRDAEQALYEDLDAVYNNPALSDAEKTTARRALFAAFPDRVAAMPLHDPDPYLRAARGGVWNNARLIQFKTYNFDRGAFETLLDRQGGDLLAFMRSVAELTRGADDPFAALAAAAAQP